VLLVVLGLLMIALSAMEDIGAALAGRDATVLIVTIPHAGAIGLLLSLWIVVAARSGGRSKGLMAHDLDVLSRHPLLSGTTVVGGVLRTLGAILLSLTFGLGLLLFLLKWALTRVGSALLLSAIGVTPGGILALLAGPVMLIGWYRIYRYRADILWPGTPVTPWGIRTMERLDRLHGRIRRVKGAARVLHGSARTIGRFGLDLVRRR